MALRVTGTGWFDGMVDREEGLGERGYFGGEEGVLDLVFGLNLVAAACAAVDVDCRMGLVARSEDLTALGLTEPFWPSW